MRQIMARASVSLILAGFASQQEPPWCFRFHGESTARCNYFSLRECLIGTAVVGGVCERYEGAPDQRTPAEQQRKAVPNSGTSREPR